MIQIGINKILFLIIIYICNVKVKKKKNLKHNKSQIFTLMFMFKGTNIHDKYQFYISCYFLS